MPHIPRRGPSIFGPAHEVQASYKPQAAKPTAATQQQQSQHIAQSSLALPTLNMETWSVPVDKIHKAIFGTEPKRNDLGELVYTRRPARPPGGC